MTQLTKKQEMIEIRQPKEQETAEIIPLIHLIMKDMELPILKEIPQDILYQMLTRAMVNQEDFRYSLKNTLVAVIDGKIAGAIFGYPGEQEPTIDDAFHEQYKEFGISTTTRLYQDSETMPGEWYLDILAVYPKYRGHGIGTTLLLAIEDLAKRDGATITALNCEVDNTNAFELYKHLGYEVHSTRTLSGHDYYHMWKKLN